ncbi:diacylglycerol kinase zeta-like isoform X2 [Gigantopelta aegis]|uniref:diacylglycerol kinase zeta-like isoform X2 n=1 Tax=Gigantopelta aegis TaxID=1735272 RepID=UPI001B88E433|nr:diacylglycerol kinase zeta-like isoform X2 [Gigantopelta aegis]
MASSHVDESLLKVDWTIEATNNEHIWVDTNTAGKYCQALDSVCRKRGNRMKCIACRLIAHTSCIPLLKEGILPAKCKPTFQDDPNKALIPDGHHWLLRYTVVGRCKGCGEEFSGKDFKSISCSWCKIAYHIEKCFYQVKSDEECSFGIHAHIIVRPSWITKTPQANKDELKPFNIKVFRYPLSKPLIVFINPKSGGQQGLKVLEDFHGLLNPRQVFNLAVENPKFGLELYRQLPHLRILACGGDGTIGWILSVLDSLGWDSNPPIAILPIGTGNDLARTLDWGATYSDEPISEFLCSVEDAEVVQLDRWKIDVVPNGASEAEGTDTLPLTIFNNYFSLGADAQVALEFHETREANPGKFKSRMRSRLYYATQGGLEIIKQKCKHFAKHITLECDGKDITDIVRSKKLHCLLFLNIPRYAGGTLPWGSQTEDMPQSFHDDIFEVVGFTYTSLAALQMGANGERLAQCQHIKLTTTKSLPVQVDGEPCLLRPSTITVTFGKKSNMLIRKGCTLPGISKSSFFLPNPNIERVQIYHIGTSDWKLLFNKKDEIQTRSVLLGYMDVEENTTLKQMRRKIDGMAQDGNVENSEPGFFSPLSGQWCFLDSKSSECFTRIDPAEEHLRYVAYTCDGDLYILDPDLSSVVDDFPNPDRPIKPSEFKVYVAELHRNSNLLFNKEWIDLFSTAKDPTSQLCAELDCKLDANSREKLEPVPDDPSNNMNIYYFIPGYKDRRYIATQDPMEETFVDFWRMIWKRKCEVIVMLADFVENEMFNVNTYWPQNIQEAVGYGAVTVKMGDEERSVRQYVMSGWDDTCTNVSFKNIVSFIRTVREWNIFYSGPIVVHCRSGRGRTGVFIALDYFFHWLLDHARDQELNVYGYVLKMCIERPNIIQTEMQYVFIYDILNYLIEEVIRFNELSNND